MAVYKIPQDVEAEDKLLGPLTIKQFVYMIIVFVSGWLTVIVAQSTITLIFLPLTLTPALFFGFLVFLGVRNSAQPAESYLAALVRFYFKPHKRIWNQEGVMDNVRITAPMTVARQYSDNLTKGEVTSRLKVLANVMDSRGWAAKDPRFQANVILPTHYVEGEDRLLSFSQLPAMSQQSADAAQTDVMDDTASPLASQFDDMIQQKQQQHRQAAVSHMNDPSYEPYPDMRQRVVSPLGDEPAAIARPDIADQTPAQPPAPPAPDATIAKLVDNASDLSVQTLAAEAQRLKSLESGDEISLH